MAEYAKPLPDITPVTRPFWEGARAHKLLIQRCRRCGHVRFPPAPVCPEQAGGTVLVPPGTIEILRGQIHVGWAPEIAASDDKGATCPQ